MTTKIIPLTSITIEDRQRKHFPEAEMEELKESILTEKGLMCPILVRPSKKKDEYILVAGERRYRTITSLTKPYSFGEQEVPVGHIPAVIKHFSSDMEAIEAELHENIIRLGLTWQEKAEAVAMLHKLKQSKDPRHNIGMTAKLVEEGDNGDYATPATYREVNKSLLVHEYLNDPDVQKAKTLREAEKVVSRKIEEEQLKKLRELAIRRAQLQAEAEAERVDNEEAGLFDGLPPLTSPEVPKVQGTFIEGDVMNVLSQVADGSINVVVTDPPYGVGVAKYNDSGNSGLAHEYSEENFEELHEFIVAELDRICAAAAHVYIFCDFEYFLKLRELFSEEWRVRRTPLIWDKVVAGKLSDGTPQGYTRGYECILFASRGKRPCSRVSRDVISITSLKNKIHAAQKPVELYKYLLKMSAIPGDTVLDMFAGSGTIFYASQELLLNPIGIELNEKFATICNLAAQGKKFAVDNSPALESLL